MQSQNSIIYSTDIGSDPDDAMSLNTALNLGLNIRTVYTVNGDVGSRSYIARHQLNLAGKRKTPVLIGESQSLAQRIEPYTYFEKDFIDDSFIDEEASCGEKDIYYKSFQNVGIIKNGTESLAKILSKSKHTIFSIAPLTGIALLVQDYPEAAKNIERLYIMGGRFSDSSIPEHNFRYDPDAAHVVLNSDIPITIIPSDLCNQFRMPMQMLKQLQSPSGQYVKHMCYAYLAIKTASRFAMTNIPILSTNLVSALKDQVKATPETLKEIGGKETLELSDKKDGLLTNLNDLVHASFKGEKYLEQYLELIRTIKIPRYFSYGEELAKIMINLIPGDLAVADVYVPYCFANRDKLKTARANMDCDIEGRSIVTLGDKHEIVMDLDFEDFKRFLQQFLR